MVRHILFYFLVLAVFSLSFWATTAQAEAVRVNDANVFVVCPTFKTLQKVVGSMTTRDLGSVSSERVKGIVPGCVVTSDSALLANILILHRKNVVAKGGQEIETLQGVGGRVAVFAKSG